MIRRKKINKSQELLEVKCLLPNYRLFSLVCVSHQLVTSKDDGVEAGFAPQLHEVDHVTEAQRRMAGENHTRLTELTAEVSVNAGVVL